ncbi:hypothetical protein CC78DRAFT_579221 [Lojkania enalia]|uniref:Cytochrome P450 n=1 Tax=Lojkania enalia TaxID=147567 RepID=A0A9P4KB96_9PLEO|nr:hypothetical protein CC78DRAFT_579221 [Didymosphaeria enalia]
MLHADTSPHPEPQTFRPERWIEAAELGKRLPLFAFSEGARNCFGINLAKSISIVGMTGPTIIRYDIAGAKLISTTLAGQRDPQSARPTVWPQHTEFHSLPPSLPILSSHFTATRQSTNTILKDTYTHNGFSPIIHVQYEY